MRNISTDALLTFASILQEPVLPEGVVPFDLDDDPYVVSEYAASIFKNMRIREVCY